MRPGDEDHDGGPGCVRLAEVAGFVDAGSGEAREDPSPPSTARPESDWVWSPLPLLDRLMEELDEVSPGIGLDIPAYLRRVSTLAPCPEMTAAVRDVITFLDSEGSLSLAPAFVPPGEPPPAARSVGLDVRPGVRKLAEQGVLVQPPDGPCVFHRVFGVPKPDGGVRVISDLRRVNTLFPRPPTFAHASPAFLFTQRNKVGTKLDLAAAFYQAPVACSLRRVFATLDAEGRPVVYRGLPMGFAWSPYLFELLLRPLDLVWVKLGVAVVRYVDDLAVTAPDADSLSASLLLVLRTLRACGWRVSPAKTYLVAASRFVFLGVLVDLPSASVAWSYAKRAKCALALERVASRRITARELTSLVGRLGFLLQATPIFRCFTRALCLDASRALDFPPLDLFAVSPAAAAEARFWLSSDGDRVAEAFWPVEAPGRRPWRVSSDASASGVGWTAASSPPDLSIPPPPCAVPLRPDLADAGSGVRELSALVPVFEYLCDVQRLRVGERVSAGDSIVLTMDARVAVAAANRGSARAWQMLAESRRLARALLDLPPFVFRCVWLPREENTAADARSRLPSLADSILERSLFRRLLAWAGFSPQVDLFASPSNAQCAAFCSPCVGAGCLSRDGLALAPSLPAYGFPPFALAVRALHLLPEYIRHQVPLLLVVPARVLRPWMSRFLSPAVRFLFMLDDESLVIPPPYFHDSAITSAFPLAAVGFRP